MVLSYESILFNLNYVPKEYFLTENFVEYYGQIKKD